MATRGTLYRCHLCSFLFGGDGPQTPGLDVTWTRGLQPIGGSTVMAGSLVELYGRIDDPGPRLAPDSRVRFDILEEDYLLTGGLDDRIDSLVGTNATAPEEGFRALSRQTEFVTLGSNETVGDFVDYLRRNRAPEYRDRIFLLEEPAEPPVFHVLAFWEARQQDDGDSDFYFVLNIDDNVDDKTEHILTVTAEPLQESAPGASLGEQPDAIEIDLTVLSEAAAQVEAEFATEQEAGRTGWQPPDFGSEIADTVDPAVANARRLVRAVQPPPPDPMSIDSGRDPWPFQHPQAAVNLDEVKPGPSPFEGNAIAIMRSWDTFRATGDRYAISFDFNRAIRWGQLLFGARAFVVIEGPLVSDTPSRYFTVRTNLLFALAANQFQSTAAGALGFVGVDVRYWQIEQRDAAGNLYMVRLIGTIDNAIVIPNYPAHRDETCAQLLGGCPFDSKRLEPVIPPERAIQEVYGPIDAALRENRRDDAAKLLIELNWNAFALVLPTRQGEFLRLLLEGLNLTRRTIQAHVGERMETAILEIVHSVRTRDELRQVVGELRGHDGVRLLVGRMDNKFWTLLTGIGERLGDDVELRVDRAFIFNLFQNSIGGNPALLGLAPRVRIHADGTFTLQQANLDELYTVANTFLNFGKSMLEGFAMLIAHPDKVLQGVWALMKAIVMIELASQGVPFALRWVNETLIPGINEAAVSVLNGWRGAQVLGDALGGDEGIQLQADIIMRVKWALIWEIASLFIGLGEIADAVKVVARGVEEAAGLLRMSRTVSTGEQALSKMNRFAELAAESGLGDAQRLLSHLPVDDIRLLERTLANAEARTLRSLDELATHVGPDSQRALDRVAERMKSLQAIESRIPGRLANDGAEAFERLASLPGASDEKLRRVLESMGQQEMNNLLDTANRIPRSGLTGDGAIPFDTIRAMSGRPGSFNALAREGYDTVAAMLRQSGGDVRLMERNFEALRILRSQAASEAGGAALTTRILEGEAAAASELRNARRTLDIMKGRCVL